MTHKQICLAIICRRQKDIHINKHICNRNLYWKVLTTNRQAGRRRSGGRTVGIVPNENVNNLFVLLANIVHFSGICLSILYVYLFVCVFGCLVVHHRPAPTWFFTWSALTTSPTPTPVEQPTEAWAWAVAALVVALFSCIAVVVSF